MAAVVLTLLVTGGWALAITARNKRTDRPRSLSPIQAGCALGPNVLERIHNGFRLDRSEDVITVPKAPNYLGSFAVTSHSGPWDYLQEVPLVAYGRRHVRATGQVPTEATLADVYPTVEDWTKTELEDRVGRSLVEAVRPARRPPKLLVFIVWDGVGRNVLERWPGRWPNLERLEQQGTSYVNATVGSSPSITPATHATLGTGAFPNRHGITGIHYRGPGGDIEVAFGAREPDDLELSTFADDYDLAMNNKPKVGLLGLRIWHIPMMGEGAAAKGGDRDQLAVIGFNGTINGNQDLYQTPRYLHGFPGLKRRIDQLDQQDGVKDGQWREHPIPDEHDNPAWARYQTDVLFEMWTREGYGRDSTPDMFFVNYKMTDIVGHQYSMDSEEMGDMLQAQDEELGKILRYLERRVRDYVLVVSADHGHTPAPERSGAWPINGQELDDDIQRHFGIRDGQLLIQQKSGVGLFIDQEVAQQNEVTLDQIARYLNRYTIAANSPKEVPEGFEDRRDEPIFEATFPAPDLDEVLSCAGRKS